MQNATMLSRRNFFRHSGSSLVVTLSWLSSCTLLTSCAPASDPELAARTQIVLMDWHVSGLWVINCPVAWIKVSNYNHVAIKEITLQYNTYDAHGRPLDQGTFTIEGSVGPMQSKNFIELYLGLVDLYSERLSIKLLSVRHA
jgi:hypothetical protein